MKSISPLIIFFILFNTAFAQNFQITGSFSDAKQKEVRLLGYNGIKDTILSKTTTDADGNFKLNYPKTYKGAATLQVKELANIILLLNQENFNLVWSDFKNFNNLQFTNSKENNWFQMAYILNVSIQNKLSGLKYLLPLYEKDSVQNVFLDQLKKEINQENSRFNEYLKKLHNSSFAKEYLNYRAILQLLQTENKTVLETNETENTVLKLDFSSPNLYHSGLAKELLDEYLKQRLKAENNELIIAKLNNWSKIIKKTTQNNPLILNEYSEYLIKQYEKFGLSEAASYFAVSLLEDNKCIIDDKRMLLFNQYKKMAIGMVAPLLEMDNKQQFKSLNELPSKYKIVIFGTSECEACKIEIPKLKDNAKFFKEKYNAEIVFVSLDTDKESYFNYTKDLPFICTCDFKGWESPNVHNFCVFATPTLFIIDENNRIVAKPIDAMQTTSWLFNNN